MQDSYQEMSSVINWCGKHSRSFIERQGVRQGGIISPTGYKSHIDPLLNLLQRMRVGLTRGTVYCGVPTVADDLLYLSRSIIELQAMLITAIHRDTLLALKGTSSVIQKQFSLSTQTLGIRL